MGGPSLKGTRLREPGEKEAGNREGATEPSADAKLVVLKMEEPQAAVPAPGEDLAVQNCSDSVFVGFSSW